MGQKSSVTVRSLAAELGVAPITVSRALRGLDSVRPELAARAQALAKKRDYRADPVVAEVMGALGRARGVRYRETVAFVWTHERSDSSAEERGAREGAAALGYRVETIKPWQKGLTEADVSRILWSRGIRGVLLAPNYSRTDPRYELEWSRFAGVLLGSSLVNTGLPRVARDYYHDARLTMAWMRETGSVRPGLVLDTSTHERTDRRYAAAFVEHGGALGRIFMVDRGRPTGETRERFLAWLARCGADALVTDCAEADGWAAPGMRRARLVLRAEQRGPGVRTDFERVGREGMRLLDGLLRENRLGVAEAPVSVLVPGTWVM